MIHCFITIENFIKLTPLLATSVAAMVAYFTIRNYNRINRKQVRSTKLEEIYSLVASLYQYYHALSLSILSVEKYFNDLKDNPSLDSNPYYLDYIGRRARFISEETIREMFNKLSKLDILIKCYTNNKLRNDLDRFHDIHLKLGRLILYVEEQYVKVPYPDINDYNEFVEELKNEIIEEIGYS